MAALLRVTADTTYLLDTNIVSELSRAQPDQSVLQHVQRHQSRCALSATLVEELSFGIMRLPPGKRRTLMEDWLASTLPCFPILPYDAEAALWLGQERARLERTGKTLARADGEIAAVAATRGLILVTRNTTDYQHISTLRTENWFQPQP